jgi:coenzyme F420 hydrogenase subunit beta
MGGPIRGITDVAEQHLCAGCGACAFAQPDAIVMVDDPASGRRPLVGQVNGRELPTVQAVAACPGVGLTRAAPSGAVIGELWEKWGPVLAIWEGYAADPAIRYAGSSGGVASALAIHAIEASGMHGLLHIRARSDVPYLNETVLSTDREQILAATGSRYAPASPCDRLDLVVDAPNPCVFVGKPCDVAATAKLRLSRELLDSKLGLTIAIFCAGTPSTRGTLEMLRSLGVNEDERVRSVRYRGNGWPGDAVVTVEDREGRRREKRLSYESSWGDILQRHRQWRCYVCADHTGEFADISVGDPWHRPIEADEPGRSLILVRNERGRRMLASAIASGAVVAEQVSPDLVAASQPGLRDIQGEVGGRIAALRILGIPTPRYEGFRMAAIWWRDLSLQEKLRSTLGTYRRVWRKRLFRRHPVRPMGAQHEGARSDG